MAKALKEVISDRLSDLDRNPFAAAERGGLNRYFLYDILEDRKQTIRTDKMAGVAKALDWSVEELNRALGGEILDDDRWTVRVMGKIGAGAEILPEAEQVGPDGLYEIELPFPVDSDCLAFEVEGSSMWPRYDPGDVIVCGREGSDFDEIIGWEAAVKTADGRRYLKRIVRGSKRGLFDLESFNAPTIRDVKLEWAAEVENVVRSGKWQKLTRMPKSKLSRRGMAAKKTSGRR